MNNKDKIILDLCGGTGAWSKPYKDNGYTVINVTLPEYDVRYFKPYGYIPLEKDIYGILAAPPCTQFSLARTNAKKPRDLREGMEIVIACLEIIWKCQYKIKRDMQMKPPLKFWALENPEAMLVWFLGKPNLIINPFDFGDNYTKRTCLWGYFNKPLKNIQLKFGEPIKKFNLLKSNEIAPDFYGKLTRQERRAITPLGFANAFYEANK